MNEDRYVAAIEVSSSKVIAAVGKMHSDGRLDILSTEQERGVETVKYGIIQNLEETAMRIRRVLERLQSKAVVAPRVITGVYVGLSGRSMRSIRTEVELNLPDDTEITDEIIRKLRDQATNTAIDSSLVVISAIPRIYHVGTTETLSPKGAVGNKIRAVYDLIVCRPDLRRNLSRTIEEKLNLRILGYEVTALATADIVLTNEEKRLGCMLVDMGAETTSVSIFKDGSLKYFATLPLGGRNITRDITSLSVLEERAEEIKVTMGNAMARNSGTSLNLSGINTSDVNNIIVERAEEIVANIIEQINYAGMKDSDLPAGIICIGGGSKLNGIIDLIARQTGLNVSRGKLPTYITVGDTKALNELLEVTGILYAAAKKDDIECLELPNHQELPHIGEGNEPDDDDDEEDDVKNEEKSPRKSGSKFWEKTRKRISNMFANPGADDSDLLE
ncbi:MAG: cell division protein FtsA [Lepagella sp.]